PVGTGGHTGATSDTGGGIHRRVGGRFRYRDQVGIGGRARIDRYVSAGFDDPVEGGPVDHQVTDEGESGRPPWLDDDGLPILELAHVELAGSRPELGAMGLPVDHHATGATDAFPAIVVEGDRLLTL